MMRFTLLLLLAVITSCTKQVALPAADGNTGILLIPTKYYSKISDSAFVYHNVLTYTGPRSGEIEVWPKIGVDYELITGLAAGAYSLDTIKTVGGTTATSSALEHKIPPKNIDIPFIIEANAITILSTRFEAGLHPGKTQYEYIQSEDFIPIASADVEGPLTQILQQDPHFSDWKIVTH